MGGLPANWGRSAPGSLLGRRLSRGAEEFRCAVRVVEGEVPGESARWSYRSSGVDRFREGGLTTLTHGVGTRLRVRFTAAPQPGRWPLRAHHFVWPAVEVESGARIEVAAHPDETERLGAPPSDY